jgi:hypothetical protein
MIRTRFEEKLRLIWRSFKMLASCTLVAITVPLLFTFMIHVFNSIDIFRDIGFSFAKSGVIPLLWITSGLMISFAIISSVHFYKQGLAHYDEAANKEYTDKDLNEWCYCGLSKNGEFVQHKRLIHKNDPKFFIQ